MSKGVKKLAQVVAGAVIGFVQGGPVGAVFGAGLAFYASEQQEKLNGKSSLRDNEPSAQTVRSSKAPVRFILGRVATGGVLVWAQEQPGTQAHGEWLHLVYVLCEGAIDALENIYLGEEEISTYGAFASYELVVNPTEVNAFLKANCPDWKEQQIGRGLSFVRLSLMYNAEKFPSGIPDARFVVRGRNDLYDPRTRAVGYSANTALHILWFLRTRCQVPDDEIVFDTFASAANVCDEAVSNADGSVSQRYRTACVIGADEQRGSVLQKLEAACGGKLIRVGGRWMLQVGAYYGPADFEITEDMVIGTLSGSTEPTNDAAINTVRGTFVDPSQSWTETDYPEVSIAEWIVRDGGEAAETLSFSYVTDAYQPQRLANMELRRRRAGGFITVPMNFHGYNCRPGRVVRANLPSLNIVGEFIVTHWSMSANEGCTVSLQQYEAAQFDDAVGKPYDPLGFINLPSGGLGSPSGLVWAPDHLSESVQGVLSWTPPTGIVSSYAVVVRQAAAAIQAQTVPASGTQCNISGLSSGNYTMSVAAIGPVSRSGEATITVSIGGPPIPEACTVQSALEAITLVPHNAGRGLNGGTYEFFYAASPSAPVGDARYLGQGLSLTHTGLAFYTNYYYYVRSANAYGKSEFLFVPAATSNDVDAYLEAITGKIDKTHLGEQLNERIDLIDGTGPGSVNDRLKEIQGEIDDLLDALEYDESKAYAAGESVRLAQRLFTARIAVPAGGANAPPNVTYWTDTGQAVEAANGLAAEVRRNTAGISELDGVVTAHAEQLSAVHAELTDPNTGLAATAFGLSSLKSTVEQIDGELTATAEKIDGLNAQLSPDLTGDDGWNVGEDRVYAGTVTVQSVTADANGATARRVDQVQASVGENSAAVQTIVQAQAGLDGKLSAMWAVKMDLAANGQPYAAGFGLGLEQGPDGVTSNFVIRADTFAVMNTNTQTPENFFTLTNGRAFLRTVFIQDGTITNAKIGGYIQSDNYVPGIQGWRLDKAGNLEFNGPAPGGGRLSINNRAIKVFDQNGIKRVQLGDLNA